MARRGWVSAAQEGTEPDDWYRLSVFDDGWVDLPGMARGTSTDRADLRVVLRVLGVVALCGLGIWAIQRSDAGFPSLLWVAQLVLSMVAVGALVWFAIWRWSKTPRDWKQATGDLAQLRRERSQGRRIRRAPGAPWFSRPDNAVDFAAALEGVRLTRASEVTDVQLGRRGSEHLVTVRLVDGSTRSYRSPDDHLPRLLSSFGSG